MMTSRSDPLSVLLDVKVEMETKVSDDLVSACYQLQCEHQYDRDRTTMKKMQAIIEDVIENYDAGSDQ